MKLAAYDPVGRGFDPIVQSNTDTNSAMVSYYDGASEMFALTVVLCDPAIPVWLDMLKFVRANSLRFTVDIGFVGFPPSLVTTRRFHTMSLLLPISCTAAPSLALRQPSACCR